MHNRMGITRVEVVVVLIMACVVTGLLLSAVRSIRETAAVTTCSNNLRQLGIATQNYASASNGRLPPLSDQGQEFPESRNLQSVFFILTPFIEAAPRMYHPKWNPPSAYYAPSSVAFPFRNKDGTPGGNEYGGAANQIRRTFLDPADATANQFRDIPMKLPDGTTGYYATGSYAANGLLAWNTSRLPESFPAGAGNTILFAERPQVCRTAMGDDVYNLWGVGFYSPHMPAFAALTPDDPPGLASTGQAAPVSASPNDGVRYGRRDAEPQSPDFRTPIQLIGRGQPCDPRLPGSPHRSGMQVGMADGSVRRFGPDTEPWIFWAYCMPGTSMNR